MDERRFDTFTKAWARGTSRRTLLKGLLGGLTGGLIGAVVHDRADAVICRQAGVLCAKDAHCCSGSCVNNHCTPAATTTTTTPPPCLPPGASCTADAQCCSQACLDTGICACFSQAGGEVPCPSGCHCDQVNPGGVGACVANVSCPTTGSCNNNADCGPGALCDESCGGVCVPRCGACQPAGASCTTDAQCCSFACLDTGVCACFSQASGDVGCLIGCHCDQVNPGGVGGCVADGSCPTSGTCTSNTACGADAFCDESCGGVCVPACGA